MKHLAFLLLCACPILRAQETLTLEKIEADRSLWPVEVMVTVDHKLPVVIDGKVVRTLKVGPGNMYKVKDISAAGVSLHSLGSPLVFKAEDTDVIARAGQIRTQREALVAATPTPIPATAPTVVASETVPPVDNAAKRYQGPLPYTITLPPGFVGPIFSQKGADKTYGYLRRNPPRNSPAAIQISTTDLKPEEEALSVDAFLQKRIDESRESGWTIETAPPAHGVLGTTPAREVVWKGSSESGKMAGKDYGFVKYGKFYSATIADAESFAPNTLPELEAALQTLRFGERPPPEINAASPLAGGAALAAPAADTLAAKLRGQLVSLNGGRLEPFDAARLGDKKFLAVYFSASWCGPCRRFTPVLVEWYEQHRADHDKFDIIFVSMDQDERAMANYMAGDGMRWPAVSFAKARSNPLTKYGGRGIPCLVILNERGRILSHSYDGENYLGPKRPLQDLAELLRAN